MSDFPLDELAPRRHRIERGGSTPFYSRTELKEQWLTGFIKRIRPARGTALDMVANAAGMKRRGLLERLPFVGDRRFRRRVEAAIKNRLGPGFGDVRVSVGYETEAPR